MYKIIFSGKIAENRDVESVKKNMATLFKLDEKGIEKLFCGSPVTVKKTEDKKMALKFKAAIEKTGGICKVTEVKSGTAKPPPIKKKIAESVPKKTPAPEAPKAETKCPKCGFAQEKSADCIRCGIVFSKFEGVGTLADAPATDGKSPDSPPQDRRNREKFEYYENSGGVGSLAPPLGLIIGGASAWGLAFVYQLIISWNPFIYINFLISAVFGGGIGYATGFGLEMGKSRHMALNFLIGTVTSGLGYYFSFKLAYETPEQVQEIVETGWVIAFKAFEVLTIQGNNVYVTWGIEALIVIACAAGGVFIKTNKPFCERCGVWTEKRELGSAKQIDVESIKRAVQNRDLNAILEFKKLTGSETRLNTNLHSCPNCRGWNLLSLEFKWEEFDDEGEMQEKSEEIDGFIILREEHLARLKQSIAQAGGY